MHLYDYLEMVYCLFISTTAQFTFIYLHMI